MFSVASIMRGEPVNFESHNCEKSHNCENCIYKKYYMNNYHFCYPEVDSYNRNSYFANYELFSTFEPDEYDRPGMRFPFEDDN